MTGEVVVVDGGLALRGLTCPRAVLGPLPRAVWLRRITTPLPLYWPHMRALKWISGGAVVRVPRRRWRDLGYINVVSENAPRSWPRPSRRRRRGEDRLDLGPVSRTCSNELGRGTGSRRRPARRLPGEGDSLGRARIRRSHQRLTGDVHLRLSIRQPTSSVDLTSVKSDNDLRNGPSRGLIMNTSQFPPPRST